MKVFEEMKAALQAQAPLDIQPPFQIGHVVAYRIPDPQSKNNHPAWQEHHGVILATNTFAEMVLIQPHDEPGIPWRWLWRGYVERVDQ